ncbi:MAG: prepilin peptidase [Akkermansia sp.]|nr:prepilin peptidase [Akkermansia sp.]
MMEMLYNATQNVASEIPWLFPVFFAMFGACIGSFLNVVIYRLPRGLSVNEPSRSFCPTCKEPIPWYLNIPILSWLMLRGRSACCNTPISVRYWLVEVATALLFGLVAWYFSVEDIITQALLCVWVAAMLATLCMDWEQMVVMPSLMVVAAVAGVLVSLLSPWFAGDALVPEQGLMLSLWGAVVGFGFFRLVGWAGTIAFGRHRKEFDQPQGWKLHQAANGDDIVLEFEGGETLLWSRVFAEPANTLVLHGAVLSDGRGGGGDISFSAEAAVLEDGTRVELEAVECLSGTCGGYRSRQAAMGSGDAWIAMGIGALLGWEGVLFSLVAGSFIGLALAVVSRVGFGRPMPFGPALILAAGIWLFFGVQIDAWLMDWMGWY